MSLTREERSVVEKLAAAFLEFKNLPQYHPCDLREFALHLHAAQNIVMAREAIRTDADLFVRGRKNEATEEPIHMASCDSTRGASCNCPIGRR